MPRLTATPCTAVRANELVIGSNGELYKCWESVGNPFEVFGNILDYDKKEEGRLEKWLKYDPFTNPECRECIALPVCMGGCAHHAMTSNLYEDRCETFRYTYRDQIMAFIDSAKKSNLTVLTSSRNAYHRMETR
ncbi:MAG: SPASM domain-containing protein [Nitrososphaeraceae archaeon]